MSLLRRHPVGWKWGGGGCGGNSSGLAKNFYNLGIRSNAHVKKNHNCTETIRSWWVVQTVCGFRSSTWTLQFRDSFSLFVITDSLWPGASVKVVIIRIRLLFVAKLWNSALAKYFKSHTWNLLRYHVKRTHIAKSYLGEMQCLAKDPLWAKYGKCSCPPASLLFSFPFDLHLSLISPWPFCSFQ